MKINGAVVLVTGASSGIGAATSRAASQAGARVVLAARREDRIRQLANDLGQAVPVRCDVTDADQVRAAVRAASEAYGRVDVLCNVAGQGLHAPLQDIDPDDFRAVLDLNLVAPLGTMQAVLPLMRKQGGGSIVNVSSGITVTVGSECDKEFRELVGPVGEEVPGGGRRDVHAEEGHRDQVVGSEPAAPRLGRDRGCRPWWPWA